MKEMEYINVSDLARVRSMQSILRTIVPTYRKTSELSREVGRILAKWEKELMKEIKIDE